MAKTVKGFKEKAYADSPFDAAIRSTIEAENRFEVQTCPACGYRKRMQPVAGSYEVCCNCLRPIHVQDDLTFRVVRLADVPEKYRQMIIELSEEE